MLKIHSKAQRKRPPHHLKCMDKADFTVDQEVVLGKPGHTWTGCTWFLSNASGGCVFSPFTGIRPHNIIHLAGLTRTGA